MKHYFFAGLMALKKFNVHCFFIIMVMRESSLAHSGAVSEIFCSSSVVFFILLMCAWFTILGRFSHWFSLFLFGRKDANCILEEEACREVLKSCGMRSLNGLLAVCRIQISCLRTGIADFWDHKMNSRLRFALRPLCMSGIFLSTPPRNRYMKSFLAQGN